MPYSASAVSPRRAATLRLMHLHLAVPDLLWPDPHYQQAGAALALPALLALLAKGRMRTESARDLNDWLLEAYGVPDAGAAAYSHRADGGDARGGSCLRADPCHLRVNRDKLVLVDALAFNLSREEAEAIAATLNGHFRVDGLRFEVLSPQRWYLHSDQPLQIETTALAQARGQDIDRLLPRGPEATQWRRMLNETQMLLHAHPVNEAREARGELPLNSIWLWGEGECPTPGTRPFQRVRTHDALAAGLAQASGASVYPVPDEATQWLKQADSEGAELIVLEALVAPACYGDLHRWEERLQAMEQNWFAPALQALRAGRIGMLSLHAAGKGGSFSVETVRQDLRYFWRRPQSLQTYARNA